MRRRIYRAPRPFHPKMTPIRRGRGPMMMRSRKLNSLQGDERAPHWMMPIVIAAGVGLLITGITRGWL